MWTVLAIVFLLMFGAFLLGIYLVVKSVAKSVKKVPAQVVKEAFAMLREKTTNSKSKELPPSTIPYEHDMTHGEWDAMKNEDRIKLINMEIEETKRLSEKNS